MDLQTTSFDQAFASAASISKQLEIRWFFYSGKDNACYRKTPHAMPFRRRNLSYIRDTVVRSKPRKAKARKRKWGDLNDLFDFGEISEGRSDNPRRKPDLLFKLFRHRVNNYNDSLLSSPRPSTRNRARRSLETDKADFGIQRSGNDSKLDSRHDLSTAVVTISCDDVVSKSKTYSTSVEISSRTTKNVRSMSPLSVSDDTGNGSLTQDLRNESSLNNPSSSISRSAAFGFRPRSKMYFHFLFREKNGKNCVQTDANEDSFHGNRRCPFCYFDGGSDYGILMHCKTTHGDLLEFDAVRNEEGTLHMLVKKATPFLKGENEQSPLPRSNRDFFFCRFDKTRPPATEVPFVKRRDIYIGTLDQNIRRKKLKFLQECGASPSCLQKFIPNDQVPIRQYFHSRTNAPMAKGDWDKDSDDEPDDTWLHKMSAELLDDFEDVTVSEKHFIKMWNRFMKSHTVVADYAMPGRCMEFIRRHISDLNRLKLRNDLLLHLFNLWDFGIIPAKFLMTCMKEFEELSKKSNMEGSNGKR